jgi:hypothetical protein
MRRERDLCAPPCGKAKRSRRAQWEVAVWDCRPKYEQALSPAEALLFI